MCSLFAGVNIHACLPIPFIIDTSLTHSRGVLLLSECSSIAALWSMGIYHLYGAAHSSRTSQVMFLHCILQFAVCDLGSCSLIFPFIMISFVEWVTLTLRSDSLSGILSAWNGVKVNLVIHSEGWHTDFPLCDKSRRCVHHGLQPLHWIVTLSLGRIVLIMSRKVFHIFQYLLGGLGIAGYSMLLFLDWILSPFFISGCMFRA